MLSLYRENIIIATFSYIRLSQEVRKQEQRKIQKYQWQGLS